MTKDRRLGRGLAALLGTPLEEDGIVESVAQGATQPAGPMRAPTPSVGTVSSSLGSNANNSANLLRKSASNDAADATRPASVAIRQPRDARAASETPTGLKLHAPEGVTGSVPLGQRNAKPATDASAQNGEPLSPSPSRSLEIAVAQIDNNPFQPRRRFNQEEIESLAESIREHQQLQPILVRQVGSRYQLISGERRLRATIHAGLKTIRAEVREADDRLVAELAIVENLQRKDLDAIEKAMSFRRYIGEHKCTQEDLARRLKIDRSTIANLMRLLELPEEIQAWVQNEKITAGHARTLLPLGDETQQLEFARRIIDESWTVRDTERKVSEQLALEDGPASASTTSTRGPRKRSTPQLALLEQQLRLSLGAKTEIRQGATGRGKIVISFANAEEFDRLCVLICPQLAQKAA